MSVRRIMGTETEYGVQARPGGNPVRWSFDVVEAAAEPECAHIRWDYGGEDPVNDMRGMRLPRAGARPDMLTDAPQARVTNTVCRNGARIYVDHAHPEYAAPETTDPFQAVAYDTAGDLLMAGAAARAHGEDGPVRLYRTNVDGKGASWGTHENYLLDRAVPFDTLSRLLMAHFVTRQQYAGAGRIGIGEHSERAGYQLSQRADYFHMKVGLQTTFDRPIVNTRDEPHAPAWYRRLHVIVGDANRMDVPRVLRLGTTSMLLWLCEHAQEAGVDLGALLAQVELADPVEAMHVVSHDLSLCAPLACAYGGETTAWQVQVALMGAVYEAGAAIHGTDTRGEPVWPDRETRSVMAMWRQALMDVATVRHMDRAQWTGLDAQASRLEWLLKWQVLERLRMRLHPDEPFDVALRDARLRAVDLRWADLEAGSLFDRLRPRTERVVADDEATHATTYAPDTTRAWLRGMVVTHWPRQVHAVSWTRIVSEPDPQGVVWTLGMTDPYGFTRQRCEQAAEQCDSLWALLARLGAGMQTLSQDE